MRISDVSSDVCSSDLVRALVMERSKGFHDKNGFSRLSFQVKDGAEHTANLQVNNHFALGNADTPSSGAEVYKLIEELWDEAYQRSIELLERIRVTADAA